jgi:hypothetical protein
MSCTNCIHNHRSSCDPDPNECGGCGSFRTDWEPDESDNGAIQAPEDIFEVLGGVFKPMTINKVFGCGVSLVKKPNIPAVINIDATAGLNAVQALPFKAAFELAIIEARRLDGNEIN